MAASGRVDNAADAWRGSIAMSVAAPRLDGITVLADKFLPQASDAMHKYGARIAPFKVNAKLDVEPRPGNAAGRTAAKLKLDGLISGIHVNFDARRSREIFYPSCASTHSRSRPASSDGGA